MTQMIKNHGGKMFAAGVVAGVVAFTVMAFSMDRLPKHSVREIVLIAKDVSFRLADQPDESNPPLRLKKGEPVKLILRNDEPGKVLHCFTIGGLNVKTTRDLATGESETLTFTPTQKGAFAYACLMHPMMTGKVVVE